MHELPFEIPQSLNTYLNRFQSDPDKGIADLEAFLKKRGMDAVGYFLLSWLCLNNGRKEEALRHALKAKSFAPGSPFFQHLHYFLVHPDHFDAWKPFAPEDDVHPEEDVSPEEEQGSEHEPVADETVTGQEPKTGTMPGHESFDERAAGDEASPEVEPAPWEESASEQTAASDEAAAERVQEPETGAIPDQETEPETMSDQEQESEPEPDPSLNLDTLIEKLSDAEKNRITISPDHDDDRNLDESSKKVGDIASETLAMIYEKQKKYSDALRTLNKLSKTRPDKADHYRQEIERIRALMNREELED